ncbi:MAG TPA: ATP-binding protein [Bacteroidia bacterium]|nr:ATP-binding protein [Bacteroidia bacterium]
MTFRELQLLVAQGEGLHLEFKQKLPDWPKLMREIVAFANTEGGTLLIGVDDDGTISGLKDPREIEEALVLHLQEWIRPTLDLVLDVVPLTRKRAVVAIKVPRSTTKPHYALEKPLDPQGFVLVRIADNSVRASKETVELLRYEGRQRDMKVEYGDKERVLMHFLASNAAITVKEYADLAGIPNAAASRTLVHLVKANVLVHAPGLEGPDRFFVK